MRSFCNRTHSAMVDMWLYVFVSSTSEIIFDDASSDISAINKVKSNGTTRVPCGTSFTYNRTVIADPSL